LNLSSYSCALAKKEEGEVDEKKKEKEKKKKKKKKKKRLTRWVSIFFLKRGRG
jgi:hypothetical protein